MPNDGNYYYLFILLTKAIAFPMPMPMPMLLPGRGGPRDFNSFDVVVDTDYGQFITTRVETFTVMIYFLWLWQRQ